MSAGGKRYSDEAAKSGEYLRLALPLMTKQAAGLHPVSYAVWYEFVSGINPALKQAVESHLAKGQLLDEQMTETLFRRYISEIDAEEAERISSGFRQVLSDISKSAEQAGDQANRFGSSLERLSEELSSDHLSVSDGIDQLLGDTRNMQSAVSSLKDQLEASQREIEALKQEVSRVREDALSDGLTGLTNRKGFDRVLEETLAAANEDGAQMPAILIADIDHFKKINDTYGHLFGDKVIKAVASVLKLNVKGKDTAARYGGEEFVVLLPDTPLKGAYALAESMRSMVEKSRIKRSGSDEVIAKITISFGVSTYRAGETAAEFVGRADQALYRSKEGGRNRVTVAAE